MRRTAATLTLLLLVVLASACGGQQQPAAELSEPAAAGTTEAAGPNTRSETTASSTLSTTTVTLVPSGGAEPVDVRVEIADDDAERQRGLMERTALAEDAGMLFVLRRERSVSFHMRNTLIPLSIAFVSARGQIVDIQDMQPLDATSHRSAAPAKYALEVNQGFFEERGIEVGDMVEV